MFTSVAVLFHFNLGTDSREAILGTNSDPFESLA